jgi:hypothetical protein
MTPVLSAVCIVVATSPLFSAEDALQPGATCIYTVSIVEGMDYWVMLHLDRSGQDFDLAIASREMDLDRFMSLPYREDYHYAREYAIGEGIEEGPEDLTLTAPYNGTAYLVIHDVGETGGGYLLELY